MKEEMIIGFSIPKNITFPVFSWIIRLFEMTSYSHVFIYWYNSYHKENMVYEASGTNVHFAGSISIQNKLDVTEWYKFSLDEETKFSLVKWAIHHANLPYDLKGAIGIGIVYLVKWIFRKDINNPFKNDRYSQFCSEMIANIFHEVLGINYLTELENAGPKKINELCKHCVEKKIAIPGRGKNPWK